MTEPTTTTLPLSRFIVSSYRVLIEIALWLFLLGALIRGAEYGGFGGAVFSVIGAFVVEIVVFGIALVILDIQTNLRSIRAGLENRSDNGQ